MDSIKISIITPSYNQGSFIEDAIQSVLNQHYTNFEHIIVDACSTDETIAVLKKYPHLVWKSEKDDGQSDAINKGFEKATGNIIGWLNADDYYLPDTFQQILSTFSANAVDVVYGNIQFVDKTKKFLRTVQSHRPVKWLSRYHCFIHSAAFFFDRKILDAGLRIDPKMHICMDKDFFAQLFYTGFKFKYLPETLTAFRWHENNKSIDTPTVKNIRYREGVTIFNKYSTRKFPDLPAGLKAYSFAMKILLVLRKGLKIWDNRKTLSK